MLLLSGPKTFLMLAQFYMICVTLAKPMLRFDVPEDRAAMLRLATRYGPKPSEASAYRILDPTTLKYSRCSSRHSEDLDHD